MKILKTNGMRGKSDSMQKNVNGIYKKKEKNQNITVLKRPTYI